MKSPTLRNISLNVGQMIHQSAYAEKMQAEAVTEGLRRGGVVFTMGQAYDHVPQDNGTMLALPIGKPEPFDFRCGRCGAGWNFGEAHKCNK